MRDLPTDPDLLKVEKALKRAGKAALDLARETRTPCYVVKIVNIAEGQADNRPKKTK